MKTMSIKLEPYNYDVSDNVFSILFNGSDKETENGLQEIPAASYQLIVSALQLCAYDNLDGGERDIIHTATAIIERLRDQQKLREWRREN